MELQERALTYKILAAAIEVHKILGPGLLESVYQNCLSVEFENVGLKYSRERAINFEYKNRKIDSGFRIDFLIEERVVLEIKSVETILPVHESQLLTYLGLSDKTVGLLVNFNVTILKNGK